MDGIGTFGAGRFSAIVQQMRKQPSNADAVKTALGAANSTGAGATTSIADQIGRTSRLEQNIRPTMSSDAQMPTNHGTISGRYTPTGRSPLPLVDFRA